MHTALAPEKATALKAPAAQTVFWYRDLPPLSAEPLEEHTLQASSARVSGTLAYRDELWSACYADVSAQAVLRLEREIVGLGGRYAHVLAESVFARHDPASGEAWLQIILTYMLYK